MNPTSNQRILNAARLIVASGVSVIPIKAIDPSDPMDKGKRPPIPWEEFQHRLPTEKELETWFSVKVLRGLAMIGGTVSGNLEFMDFDEPGMHKRFIAALPDPIRQIVDTLPLIITPSGGHHIPYRCSGAIGGNVKLARTLGPDGRLLDHGGIEVRGEGGYVLCPPSPAEMHPTGKAYILDRGRPDKIPIISPEVREILFETARSFNQYTPLPKWEPKPRTDLPRLEGALRPGDDYNQQRGLVQLVLIKHGWRMVIDKGDEGSEWLRPGKAYGDGSGGLDYRDGFICFSSSVPQFEQEKGYSPFDVYVILEHNGDYDAATKAIGKLGFGSPLPPKPYLNGQNGHHPAVVADWANPKKLAQDRLPEFPLHVLPSDTQDMVREVTRVGAVPVDMAAMAAMSVHSAATRGRVRIHVGEMFPVHTNTFTVVVADVAERKSFVVDHMSEALKDLEVELFNESQPRVKNVEMALANIDNRILGLRNTIRNSAKMSSLQKDILEEEIKCLEESKPELIFSPQILVNDCNTTTLAALMAKQLDNSAAILSEEGGFFDTLISADGKRNDFDFILNAANQESTRVNRTGRGFIPIPKPSLTITLMVQPIVVEAIVKVAAFKGKGLLSRFMYCYPPPSGFTPFNAFDAVDPGIKRRYAATIRRMFEIPHMGTKEQPREWHHVLIDPWSEAMRIFEKFSDEVQLRSKDEIDGDLPNIKHWSLRLAGHAARLAGLLHMLRCEDIYEAVEKPITEDAMASAVEIARWLIPQAQKVFGAASTNDADKLAVKGIAALQRINKSTISVSELALKLRHEPPAALSEMVPYLVTCGYLKLTQKTGFYEVNPAILTEKKG